MIERPTPPPIFVLRPRLAARFLADGLTQVVLGAALLAAPAVASAWLPWPSGTALLGDGLALVYVLAVGAGLVALHRWASVRVAEAELHDDRIVVRTRREVQTYHLAELESFDDARGDLVRLRPRPRPGVPAREVCVPTSVERARALLVDALARAGVPRVEGAARGPRPRRRDAPRLVVAGQALRLEVLGGVGLVGTVVFVLVGSRRDLADALRTASVLAAIASGVAALLTLGVAGPRRGRVWFFDDRLEHEPTGSSSVDVRRLVVAWDEVVGWRDPSPGYLQLVLREGLLRETHGDLPVPTPTPEQRAAVEALLAEQGVPRLT